MGKPWQNHRKTMGKPWEDARVNDEISQTYGLKHDEDDGVDGVDDLG